MKTTSTIALLALSAGLSAAQFGPDACKWYGTACKSTSECCDDGAGHACLEGYCSYPAIDDLYTPEDWVTVIVAEIIEAKFEEGTAGPVAEKLIEEAFS